MGTDSPSDVIVDTCVLINFLQVDQVEMLSRHPFYRVVITNHVRSEVLDHYGEQSTRLDASLNSGHVHEIGVSSGNELAIFSKLVQQRHLGVGECSSIAAAVVRQVPLATDDVAARKHIAQEFPGFQVANTTSLIVDLIRGNVLDVQQADALKDLWAAHYRFCLRISSFSELL